MTKFPFDGSNSTTHGTALEHDAHSFHSLPAPMATLLRAPVTVRASAAKAPKASPQPAAPRAALPAAVGAAAAAVLLLSTAGSATASVGLLCASNPTACVHDVSLTKATPKSEYQLPADKTQELEGAWYERYAARRGAQDIA